MAYTTVDDAGSFYNALTWTGDGSTTQAQTGLGFQPDFVWIKYRAGAESHVLFDSVRGVTDAINSNTTAAEASLTGLKSFDADGFSVGPDGKTGSNTYTYIGWSWKAGTTTGIAGSPSVTPSSYTFNQTSGFSAIAFTGNGVAGMTIPHGLGVAPDMVIVKRLDSTSDWAVYHSGIDATAPEDYQMVLNTTAARSDDVGGWNDTAPTATLVSLGANNNTNTATFIAYCFTNIKGYSRFGNFTGNGNADGPFVYLGFRPAFLIVKDVTGSNNWTMFDDKREPAGNPTAEALQPNTTVAEYDETDGVDFLSNGFKVRESADWINRSGQPTIYVAFASNPFVNSNGVPNNAY